MIFLGEDSFKKLTNEIDAKLNIQRFNLEGEIVELQKKFPLMIPYFAEKGILRCIVCHEILEYFLSKNFNLYNLVYVDYCKCSNCGMLLSATHCLMSDQKWAELNMLYRQSYLDSNCNNDDLGWGDRINAQAEVILDCYELGLIPKGRMLDYACGNGKLASRFASEKSSLYFRVL